MWCGDFYVALRPYLDAVQHVQRSSKIETLQEAQSYYQQKFKGGAPVSVQVSYKGKTFDITIQFSSDHAYTQAGRGGRGFDVARAKAMDHIWNVLRRPDVVTWSATSKPPHTNKVYDKEIQALESTIYGRVVLVPMPSKDDLKAGVCTNYEFASWHTPTERQHKASFENRYKTDPTKTRGRP